MLDGVIIVVRTTKKPDLALLDKMLESEPDYIRWDIDMGDPRGYAAAYDRIQDDILYIKMDDDIV